MRIQRLSIGSLIATLSLTLMILCTPERVNGQEFRRFDDIETSGTSYHVFAKEGEATVEIMVLGSVGRPGVYVIGTEIELDQLMALTGGTSFETSATTKTRTTVRIFRKIPDRRELLYEAPIDRMMTEPGRYPPLQDGDIVLVESITEERTPFTWREVLSIISSIASLVLIYDRITR